MTLGDLVAMPLKSAPQIALAKVAGPYAYQTGTWASSTTPANDVVAALLRTYDHLPEEIQSELPLKRIWALVPEE